MRIASTSVTIALTFFCTLSSLACFNFHRTLSEKFSKIAERNLAGTARQVRKIVVVRDQSKKRQIQANAKRGIVVSSNRPASGKKAERGAIRKQVGGRGGSRVGGRGGGRVTGRGGNASRGRGGAGRGRGGRGKAGQKSNDSTPKSQGDLDLEMDTCTFFFFSFFVSSLFILLFIHLILNHSNRLVCCW